MSARAPKAINIPPRPMRSILPVTTAKTNDRRPDPRRPSPLIKMRHRQMENLSLMPAILPAVARGMEAGDDWGVTTRGARKRGFSRQTSAP